MFENGLRWTVLRCRDKPPPAKGAAAVGHSFAVSRQAAPGEGGGPRLGPVGRCVFQARGLIAVGQRLAPMSKARANHLKKEILVIFFSLVGTFSGATEHDVDARPGQPSQFGGCHAGHIVMWAVERQENLVQRQDHGGVLRASRFSVHALWATLFWK